MAGKGGYRPGAGRKSRAEEVALKRKLQPFEPEWYKQLEKGMKAGDPFHLKTFAEYYFGKPAEKVKLSNDEEEGLVIVLKKPNA